MDGMLRFYVQKAEDVSSFLKRQGDTPQPMGVPGGAAPAPAGGPATVAPDATKTGGQIVSRLTGTHGFSPVAAAGVTGGLYQESGFDPGYGFTRPGGDNGTAHGIAQWRLDRAEGLKKFAAAQGKPPTDLDTQVDYLVSEMKSGDMGAQRAYAMLQQAKTPEEATVAMMHFFRPAGYTPNNPQGGHGYQQRVQYAQRFASPSDAGAVAGNPAQMPSVSPQQVGAVPGNPAAMPGGFPMPPGVEQGGGEGQQPVAAPPTIGPLDPVTDNLDALKSGGWLRAGKNNVQLKGPTGGYLYINPQSGQTIEYKPKEDKGGVPGPYVGQSVQGQSLNILVNEGILTVRQAAELGAGKVIQLSDGSTMFFGPQGLVTQPPQGVPNGGGAQPPQPGQPAPASSAPPGAVQLGGPKQTKEMEDYKKARIEFERINAAAQDFLKEWNSTSSNDRLRSLTGANTPLNTSYNILALLSKGEALFNLGVLNGPDLALIRRTLPDPSTLLSGLTKPEDVEKAVGKVVGIMQGSIATREKSLGIAPTAPAADAPKVRKFNPDTGKLE
jgi:hypothetical protein